MGLRQRLNLLFKTINFRKGNQLIEKSQFLKPVKNQRGVAMMLALSLVALLIYLAVEVSYDTSVEYTVNSQDLNRLKAYYAARGSVELGLLRVKIYQTIKTKYGSYVKNNPYVDQIWNFPFQWPFPIDMVSEALGTEKPEKDDESEEGEEKSKESFMDAQYTLTITDEGSKIDINDLNSPSETIRKNTEKLLLGIFEEKIKNDENFRRSYGTFRFEDLINNIRDFMSGKWQSTVRGDKRQAYSEFQSQEMPPNRGFRTVAELRLVPDMNDELFALLEPRITLYGLKGVNPNTATKDALQSLDPGIDSNVANEVITQREKEPFENGSDFYNFVAQKAAQRLVARSAEEWPLTFETLTSFRITAQGQVGNVSRKITAITIDVNSTAARIKEFVDKDKKSSTESGGGDTTGQPAGSGTTPTSNNKKTAETLPKGPPRIVYWFEQ